jgi:nucleoside-diphosphate-sugar epimerase
MPPSPPLMLLWTDADAPYREAIARAGLDVRAAGASAVAVHAVPRHNAFSIVHVSDVVRAILAAADHPAAPGRSYFLGNEVPTTWGNLYAEVARAASVRRLVELQIPLSALALAGAVGDVVSALTGWHTLANGNKTKLARPRWWLCDSSRAGAELGWHESIPLQQGVRDTYLWYLRVGWMRARQSRSAVPSQESQA